MPAYLPMTGSKPPSRNFPLSRPWFLLLLACWLSLAPRGNCAAAQPETFVPEPAVRLETLTAYTRPLSEMTLSTEVSGRVEEVRADVGQPIPADGVFAVLDATFVRLDINALQVERQRLISKRDYLEKETRRYRDLAAGEHADQSTLDKYEQDLDQALMELSALKVNLASEEERLQRHTITAPAGFTVIEREVEPGEWVNVGQSLATLGNFRTLVAPFALDQAQYEWVLENTHQLILHAEGLFGQGDVGHTAWLHEISPSFDPETRKINVELAFAPESPGCQEARGGLRVELRLPLPDRSGAMLVPASGVSKRYEQYWLTKPDGSRLDVVLLGEEPDGRLRVQAPGLDTTQHYLLHPQESPAPEARQGS